MSPKLCVFEDAHYRKLYPLTLTRPVFDLRCGMFTLLEKLVRNIPGLPVVYQIRNELVALMRERHPDTPINQLERQDTCFINGRFVLKGPLPQDLPKSTAFVAGGETVGGFLLRKDFGRISLNNDGTLRSESFEGLPAQELAGFWIRYPWDLVHHNAKELEEDFTQLRFGGHILGKVYPNVTLLDQANIYLAPGARLYPGVVINGESGPVYIGEGSVVMANAVIEGPAYIGRQSRIKIGAKIYEGTTIGDVCKVGGEVEESIIHGYSNKQHEGFLGHAYLGEWVNLGADTQ